TPSSSCLSDVHILEFRVPFHRSHSEIPANTALFEPAEGRLDMHAAMGVDAYHATLNLPRNPQCSAQIVSPKRGAQSIGRVVHLAKHLLLVGEGGNADDRTKYLLTPAARLLFYPQHHCGLKIISLGMRASSARSKITALR